MDVLCIGSVVMDITARPIGQKTTGKKNRGSIQSRSRREGMPQTKAYALRILDWMQLWQRVWDRIPMGAFCAVPYGPGA